MFFIVGKQTKKFTNTMSIVLPMYKVTCGDDNNRSNSSFYINKRPTDLKLNFECQLPLLNRFSEERHEWETRLSL